jgi:DNA polymerase (family 10)
MLALQSANPFRVRAYQNAARTLRRRGGEVADMLSRGEDLTTLEGVGEDLAGKIRDLAETGTTPIYDKLKRETPAVAFALLELPGLGPKRVRALVEELDVHTLDQLKRAARDGRVRMIPGFGATTEATLLKALGEREKTSAKRTPIAAAASEADALVAYLRQATEVADAVVAGSYRRGRETVGDLDLVACSKAGRAVVDHFVAYPGVARAPAAGSTRATVILKTGLQVDLRVVPPESFGAALAYFTGSKAHVVAMRTLARERGLKLNEYGLFRGDRRLAGEDEASVYARLGLDLIPPELREAQGEIEAARAHALPHLVAREDIQGDLHLRDDGAAVASLAAAARKRGLSYVAVASRLERLGRSTLVERRRAIDAAKTPGLRLFQALEVGLAPDGTIAAPESVLRTADFVIAAADGDHDLSRAQQTERLLAAIANPFISVLAHPTGRLIGRLEPFDADWPRILRAAAAAGVAIELSGDPDRLDLTDVHCRMARDLGAKVAIGSEARAPEELDRLRFALMQARRGWLEPGDVLNSAPAADALKRLRRGR